MEPSAPGYPDNCGFPPGTVDFTIDGGTPIPVKIDDTGHATYQIATLATGTHTIVVSYSGDSKYSTSTATLAIATGSGQTSTYGTPYKAPLTVLVEDAKGNPSPGVIVTFTGTGLKFSSPPLSPPRTEKLPSSQPQPPSAPSRSPPALKTTRPPSPST